ncbi:MAG: SDR family oxidoreductase [Chloroflexi bacterium]|nr:SDR family oxidoreductase [Chloroflexota bacterium]
MAQQTVLITGASSGIGKATAKLLAEKGYRVFGAARRPEVANDLADEAKSKGHDLTLLSMDVRDDASVKAGLDKIGEVDILVNNAGFAVDGPLEEMTVADLEDQFATNVSGPFRLITAVLPGMRQRGRGVIVNVSSISGVVASPLNGIYSSSKWALEALSESLHFEVGHFGIRIHIIEPGSVETPFGDNARRVGAAAGNESPYHDLIEQWETAQEKLNPGGSTTQPEEVAAVIVDAIENGDKLRYPVGNDANMVITARKNMDFEAFESVMRQQLGLTW